jgi:hypothetical protein
MFLMGMWTDVKKKELPYFLVIWGVWPLAQSVWSVVSIRPDSRNIPVCPVSPLISLGHSPPIAVSLSVCSSVPTAVKYPGSEHCRRSHLTPCPTHTQTQRIRIAVCGRSIQYRSGLRHHVPLRRSAFIIELQMQRLHVVGRGVGGGNTFSVAHTLWAEV